MLPLEEEPLLLVSLFLLSPSWQTVHSRIKYLLNQQLFIIAPAAAAAGAPAAAAAGAPAAEKKAEKPKEEEVDALDGGMDMFGGGGGGGGDY